MKIHLKSGSQCIRLRIPTMLVFSRGFAWLGKRYGLKYGGPAMENIPPEAISALFAEFRRIKKKHGSWELVNIESGNGDSVLIVL